jgi:aspartyl-tRNA(Asn)/glutamyl-tRNA(Gln) amidotransferase subunit A
LSNGDLCASSAAELATLVRTEAVSPVEVTRAFLERIERLNPELRAFVHLDREGALDAARQMERNGPLAGVPIAYKDIIDVAGLPTRAGSRVFADRSPAAQDAELVARVRASGAICLGKLNTTEFASGDMAYFGEARNPWDTSRTTGGSSSGPAGAVAARLTPLAVGTDTGGSVRVPAAFCGIVGLRPSPGRVSPRGIVPLSWTHDAAGPMARSVADAALLLSAMTGDPQFATELAPDIRGLRIGVTHELDPSAVEPDVLASVQTADETLRDAGATLTTVRLPDLDLAYTAQWALAYSEAWLLHRELFAAKWTHYGARFRHKIAGAALLTAEEMVLAQRVRARIKATFDAAFTQVDAIVMPTTGHPANRIGEPYPGGDAARLTRPVSVAQLPALSVPSGFTASGLPIGMQVIGDAGQERILLRIGRAIEAMASEKTSHREPAFQPSNPTGPTASPVNGDPSENLSAAWVLDAARLLDLPFISESDAAAIGASIGPIKHALARARATHPHESSLPAC